MLNYNILQHGKSLQSMCRYNHPAVFKHISTVVRMFWNFHILATRMDDQYIYIYIHRYLDLSSCRTIIIYMKYRDDQWWYCGCIFYLHDFSHQVGLVELWAFHFLQRAVSPQGFVRKSWQSWPNFRRTLRSLIFFFQNREVSGNKSQ